MTNDDEWWWNSVKYQIWFTRARGTNTFQDMNYCPVWFLVKSSRQWGKFFLGCSQYFSRTCLTVFYNVVKFQRHNCNTSWDMNYYPVWFLVKSIRQLENFFLECSQSRMHLTVFYNVVKSMWWSFRVLTVILF